MAAWAVTACSSSDDDGSTDDAEEFVVPVLSRDMWDAAPARSGGTTHTIERLTVHHSAYVLRTNEDAPAHLQRLQAEHQRYGWVDIAYHYLIDLEGNVYAGRDARLAGDTFTTYDPTGHLLVCMLGHFDRQQLGSAQLDALVSTLASGAHTHQVAASTIAGHNTYEVATVCPGRAIDAVLRNGTLRRRTELLLDSRTPRFGEAA
ncbi:MAG: peptidoglycan recognition protein family protein [Nocardioidaceae bacterium]